MKERKFYKRQVKGRSGESFGAAIQGIDGCMIQVEADVSDGLPCFSMVGFLASEVKKRGTKNRLESEIVVFVFLQRKNNN